jgi:short-subunit dehydrogenase
MKPQMLSVVLTGATDPVGAELARTLVSRGARVLLVSRRIEPLVALARALAPDDHRYRVDALAADIATPHGCRAVVDAATARGVNALANAPGTDLYTRREAHTADAVAAAGLAATVQMTRALLPHLLGQPEARVLNIGPSFVDGVLVDADAIRASQNALRGVSESFRRVVAGSAVRVQFLGRRSPRRALPPYAAGAGVIAGASRNDRPEYIASVATEMLLAGTRERFLGLRGDLLGRMNGVVSALFNPAPKHRRA